MDESGIYYSDYLQLDKILQAQDPESAKHGVKADDEMLFIVIHQTYELWFKQILHEVNLVRDIFQKPGINDNSPDLQIAVHRLKRVTTILKILVDQIDVLQTMTPLDFLDFRDLLKPASGFQSIQFKIVEAAMGLRFQQRFGHQYYLSQLRPEDVKRVHEAEKSPSMIDLLKTWLERMPFFGDSELWKNFNPDSAHHPFWVDYGKVYEQSLQEAEKTNLEQFNLLFLGGGEYPEDRRLNPAANRSALFIMLYRDYPMLQLPYQLLNTLLDIDDLMGQWRFRHVNMVTRMIGRRIGTGGSTGAAYLKSAAESHYVFRELADFTSFMIDRNHLPKLSRELENKLGYSK